MHPGKMVLRDVPQSVLRKKKKNKHKDWQSKHDDDDDDEDHVANLSCIS